MQPEVENGCEKAIHAITYGVNGPGIWLDWMRWRQGIAAGFTASSVSGAIAYEVTRYDIGELDRAIADGDARGFVKALTPPGSDRILGVTIVGAHAGDLIAEVILIMKYKLRLNKDPGHHSYLPDLGRSKQVFGRRLAACPCLAAYARLAGALPSLATRGLTRDLSSAVRIRRPRPHPSSIALSSESSIASKAASVSDRSVGGNSSQSVSAPVV